MSQIVKIDGFNFHVDPGKEPRISSELLARKLGYDNRQGLERLAERHREFLNDFDEVATVTISVSTSVVPRSVELALYTREQALYLITKSEKTVANQLTVQLIKAFKELEKQLTPQLTPEALILAQAQTLYAQRQRIDLVEADLEQVKLSIRKLEAGEVERKALGVTAIESLRLLPKPTVAASVKTVRASLNECVRQYGIRNGGAQELYQEAWNKLYRELRLRDRFDAKRRASNKGIKPLDVVESAGKMDILYAIACEVLA
jgi:phage regulator Rha-like protein